MQQSFPMITDGGPHPPDKWAEMTARRIIEDIATTVVVQQDGSRKKVVLVDDKIHDLDNSSHPKVVGFRKALRKYQDWLQDEVEKMHAAIQSAAREDGDYTVPTTHIVARTLVDGAKQFHVGLHGHLSADGAMAAMVHRLQLDFGSIIDIEQSYRAKGFTVDESHRAVKTGPA